MSDALDHPFWHFSLAFYDNPQVQQLCLDLQNRYGLDVNLLLFACWLGQNGRKLQLVPDILQRIQIWQQEMVSPIRQLRRQLDPQDPLQRPLREALQQAELKAECYEQWLLYQARESLSQAEDEAVEELVCGNLLDVLPNQDQSEEQLLRQVLELASMSQSLVA